MFTKYLTLKYPIQKHLFLVPKFAMFIVGIDPERQCKGFALLWPLFNWAVLAYGDYAEFYYGVYFLTIDFAQSLDAFCPVASSIMSWVKLSALWWHRDRLKRLIEHLRRLTQAEQGAEKLKLKQRYYLLATRFTATVMLFGMCTSSSYSIRPIIRNAVGYLNGKEFIYETPFNMKFPDALMTMPLYPITFIFSHWHGYVTVLAFVSTEGFFLGCCLYFTVLLKSLQIDVKELLSEQMLSSDKNAKANRETEICDRLQKIIERHNAIADMVSEFSVLMEEITLAHFIFSSLTICMCIVDLLLFSGYGAAVYVIHTLAVLTELFLYCYGGTAIMESSEELAVVAYSSHWYTHSVKVQKMVLLLMIRSQRSLLIKVPFFAPSLPVYASILRFSGSLIALFKPVL